MVSYGEVRNWEPGPLDTVVSELTQRGERLRAINDELSASGTPEGWSGEGANGAREKLDALREEMEQLVVETDALRRAVGETADAVERVKSAVEETDELAARNEFAIDDNGRVTDVAGPQFLDPADADDYHRLRERLTTELTDRVEQVLRRAEDVDNDLADVLARAVAGEIDDAADGALSVVGPPENGSPFDNAAWWDTLSDAEREQLIREHPEWLGNLDGIPAEVRDEANRSRIDGERERLEERARELRADLDDNWFGGTFTNADAELDSVNAKLDSLDKIEETLAQPGERQLLLLDLSNERAEAAIANGNVDTADHVAVFTPGLDATVNGSLGWFDDAMDQLQHRTEQELMRYGDGGSVATVTWIGYQTPQWTAQGVLLDENSVLQDHSARQGAESLAPFLNGIDAARDTDPHLTALGHSYGSTTTGLALQQNTGVDDAVFYGSPGLGTSDIDNLNVPSGHSYYIEARNDAVGDTGFFGIDPSHMDGVHHVSAEEHTLPDGRRLTESVGHSAYTDDGSTSQYNLSVVVGGMPERAVGDDGKGLGDILSWPVPGTY